MKRMIFILVPARSVGTQRERFAHVRSQRQSVGTRTRAKIFVLSKN